MLNYVFALAARIAPSLKLRNWVLRRIGATVGRSVSWGLEVAPDVLWPELITIEGDAIIGHNLVILCYELLRDGHRTGEVVVGERAMISTKVATLPGARIGEGAQVAVNSLIMRDVPAGEMVVGVPARPMFGDETDGA